MTTSFKTLYRALGAFAQCIIAVNAQSSISFQSQQSRANAVKEAFRVSWEGYSAVAFGHDTLEPLSGGAADDLNGWGVTAIDSLSTAIIMGDTDAVGEILELIPTIDFTTTPNSVPVSVFETNIRYLGGLLSGYDLLKGPFKNLAPGSDKVDALLKQAVSLADTLSFAFETRSGVPDNTLVLNPSPGKVDPGSNSIAGMGTLVLEWTRLSDLAGDDKYARLVQRAEQYLLEPTGVPEAFPGLVGSSVNTVTGEFTNNQGGWSGGSDSFYEYLIKMYLYDPQAFSQYKDRWVLAADSTMEHLASHPTSKENLTFLAGFDGPQIVPTSSHLASFAGGNFILGGTLLDEKKYIDFGLNLTLSYYETYRSTASGIGPEAFSWGDGASVGGSPPDSQVDFYNTAGFWTTFPAYILRPETVESLYYAYRSTGDTNYQDLAWEAFNHIQKACGTPDGFSGIRDVTRQNGGGYDDSQQSFWLAETLKYLYLIFDTDSPVHVGAGTGDAFVFNTEAHPLRVRH